MNSALRGKTWDHEVEGQQIPYKPLRQGHRQIDKIYEKNSIVNTSMYSIQIVWKKYVLRDSRQVFHLNLKRTRGRKSQPARDSGLQLCCGIFRDKVKHLGCPRVEAPPSTPLLCSWPKQGFSLLIRKGDICPLLRSCYDLPLGCPPCNCYSSLRPEPLQLEAPDSQPSAQECTSRTSPATPSGYTLRGQRSNHSVSWVNGQTLP